MQNPSTLTPVASTLLDVRDQAANPWYVRTDLNHDGLADFVFYANSLRSFYHSLVVTPAAELRVLEQQPGGGFIDKSAEYIPGNRSSVMGVDLTGANFNGDMRLDFALAGSGWDPYLDGKGFKPDGWVPGEQSLFYTSGENGRFSITDSQYVSIWAHNVAVGDINGDGFDDVFLASLNQGEDRGTHHRSFIGFSDGKGGFLMDQTHLPRLLVEGMEGPVHLSPRTYVDETGRTIYPGDTFTGSVLFDANGDGHVDLAVLPLGGTKAGILYFNNGAGSFSDARSVELPPGPYGYGGWDSVEWKPKGSIQLEGKAADIDGDADDDLIIISTHQDERGGKYEYYDGSRVQFLKNDGQGNFSIAQELDMTPFAVPNFTYHSNLEVVDINRDGLPDVVLTAPPFQDPSATTVILINRGGWFENQTWAYLPGDQALYMPFHNDGQLGFMKYEQSVYGLDGVDGTGLYQGRFTHLMSDAWVGHTIAGSAESEFISGSSSADIFLESAGHDILDGREGADTLVTRLPRENYRLDASEHGWRLSLGSSSASLSSVEYIVFKDNALTFLEGGSTHFAPDSVFRFYNSSNGTHFYTGSAQEAATVLSQLPSYVFEGPAYRAVDASTHATIDVHRFYNEANGSHFYTANRAEAEFLASANAAYRYEGVVFQAYGSPEPGSAAVHRFFNSETGAHFYTANESEADNVKLTMAGVMSYEGVAFYVEA